MESRGMVLLDTNALIWLLTSEHDTPLGKESQRIIRQASVVYASAVSVLEIHIKTMLGKLSVSTDLVKDIELSGLKGLSFDMRHANAIRAFPALARHDPFDRMLLAQAQSEQLSLLTSDSTLLRLHLPFVLDARA